MQVVFIVSDSEFLNASCVVSILGEDLFSGKPVSVLKILWESSHFCYVFEI